MGVTHLLCEGRRLMPPSDRGLEDHEKELSVAGEVRSYVRHEAGPKDDELAVVYVRSFHRESWRYRVIALDFYTGQFLATALEETWGEARARVERELEDLQLI